MFRDTHVAPDSSVWTTTSRSVERKEDVMALQRRESIGVAFASLSRRNELIRELRK